MQRLRLFIVLLIHFTLSYGLAQPTANMEEQRHELDRMMTELSETSLARDLLEGTGVQADALRSQERRRAREIAQFFRNNPAVLNVEFGQLASAWFHQLPSRQAQYNWIVDQYLGYQVIFNSDREKIFERMKFWGVEAHFRFRYLQEGRKVTPSGEVVEFKSWVIQKGLLWIESQNQKLASGNVTDFKLVLDPLLQALQISGNGTGIYHFFVANQSVEVRFKIIDYLLSHPVPLVRISFLGHISQNVSVREWIRNDSDLFRKLIRLSSSTPFGAEKFVTAYGSREFLTGTFSIVSADSLDGRGHLFTERGGGFSTGEQLMLMSEYYRKFILGNVVNNQNKEWALEFVRFAVDQGFTDVLQLGMALGKSFAMEDARWPQWMLALDDKVRSENLESYVRASLFYRQTSEEALQVHRLILSDARTRVMQISNYGTGQTDPLDHYLRMAMANPVLYKEVIFPSLAEVFANYEPKIWKRYIECVVMQVNYKADVRLFLLDLINESRINDLELLRLLNRAFGVPESFRSDISRARDSAVELELRLMAFDQVYYESSRSGAVLRCQEVYAH